jgi:hypothetical protein
MRAKNTLLGIAALVAAIQIVAATDVFAKSALPVLANEEVHPSVVPAWVVSGTWTESPLELLLVDAVGNSVLRYSSTGSFLGAVPNLEGIDPSLISSSPGGALLEGNDGQFVWLNRKLEVARKLSALNLDYKSKAATLASVFAWAPASDGHIYAFGDIRREEEDGSENWSSAFVRFPVAAPQKIQIIKEFSLSDPVRNFNLLGMPFIATVGKTGYFLVMDSQPYILGWSPGRPKPIRMALPADFGTAPKLPEKKGVSSAGDLFKTLETASMPSGLYGWKGSLFVLIRRSDETQKTQWLIGKVDPTGNAHPEEFIINSSANHLVVIPGPGRWAVLEKGPVISLGQQQVKSLLLLDPTPLE